MKIYKGTTGLNETWQEKFKATTKCYKCRKEAKIMFTAREDFEGKGKFICNLYETTGEEGGLWLHDAMAVACYLCPYCFEATAIVNQA